MQWPSIDGRVHRVRVTAAVHSETFGFIEKSMALDERHLTILVGGQLQIEFAPLLAELPVRLSGFLDRLFSHAGVASLLRAGFSAADAAVWRTPQNLDRAALSSEVEDRLIRYLVNDYRAVVLDPAEHLPKLRVASQRAFAGLRRDLLQVCGVYDQAFYEMILKSRGLLETFDDESVWRSVPLRSEAVTVRSLCGTLRLTDGASYEIAQKVLDIFGEWDDETLRVLRSILRPLAEAVVDWTLTAQTRIEAMNRWGIPMLLARWSATAISFLSGGWDLAGQWWWRLEGMCGRLRFEPVLRHTLRTTENQLWTRLSGTMGDFVAAEMTSMTLALRARQYKGDRRP